MLNRLKYFSIAALLVCLAACEKNLDINPTQSIDETQALNTSSDVEAALVGAYSDLGDDNVYGGGMFVISELLANDDDFNWTGTFQGYTQIFNKSIPVNNGFAESTWMDSYQAINDVNNVLNALEVVTPTKKNSVEGEAKFIRGSIYFDLVRLYARAWNDGDPAANDGVPLILTPTRAPLNETSQKSRDKVAVVYAQVIKDLTEAETLLPATNSVFATKAAAAAMLSRVYLQKGDYANAGAAADRAIKSNRHALEDTYLEVFPYNPNNPNEDIVSPNEYIFSMQVTSSQGINDLNTYFSTSGRGDIDINDSHLDLYEPNDDRLSIFYDDGGTRTGKFDMVYGNVPVIRLAEMYLTRAEANFRLGTAVGATPLADINRIRQRVNLEPLTVAELTLDKILRERKLELAFEGQALHDIKRTQGSVGGLQWNAPKLVLPIPDREIKINKNLTQNQGY